MRFDCENLQELSASDRLGDGIRQIMAPWALERFTIAYIKNLDLYAFRFDIDVIAKGDREPIFRFRGWVYDHEMYFGSGSWSRELLSSFERSWRNREFPEIPHNIILGEN